MHERNLRLLRERAWRRLGGHALLIGLMAVLAGCASAPVAPVSNDDASRLEAMFADEAFDHAEASQAQRRAAEALLLSEDMERFAKRSLVEQTDRGTSAQVLYATLFERGRVLVEYSSDYTRNAQEAFAAKRGNCLSLALMTAAFAKRVGVGVRFQLLQSTDLWSRGDQLKFLVGHVNVALLGKLGETSSFAPYERGLTVDFVPPSVRDLRTVKELSEDSVVAMYLSNLASEALDAGHADLAYHLIKQSLRKDPQLAEAYNTLAVILDQRSRTAQAELALRTSLRFAPDGLPGLTNLISLLERRGGVEAHAELVGLRAHLHALQPRPPFADMDEGVLALQNGDLQKALAAFLRQRERTGIDGHLQQYLAATYARLGRMEEAQAALNQGLRTVDNEGQRNQLLAKKKALLQATAKLH